MRLVIFTNPPKKDTLVHIQKIGTEKTLCNRLLSNGVRVDRKPYGRPWCARCQVQAEKIGMRVDK